MSPGCPGAAPPPVAVCNSRCGAALASSSLHSAVPRLACELSVCLLLASTGGFVRAALHCAVRLGRSGLCFLRPLVALPTAFGRGARQRFFTGAWRKMAKRICRKHVLRDLVVQGRLRATCCWQPLASRLPREKYCYG